MTEETKGEKRVEEEWLVDAKVRMCAKLTPEESKKKLKEVYEDIRSIMKEYLDMPEEHSTIISLWIIGTYLHDQFETFPYLFFNAMKGSGKTRILKLITSLAKQGQVLTSLTEAVLFRTVGTLGIDEFETLGSKEKQALRELLNASYKKGIRILRMKRKKTMEGDEQVVEQFEPYRPIVMANIWGIEEVLGDRCISLVLEKSDKSYFTKLIEDFSSREDIINLVHTLICLECSLCSVVSPRNVISTWNSFIKHKYTLHTLPTLTTFSNTNYTQKNKVLTAEEEDFCEKIDATGLNGRHLELYFPLFLIAKEISEQVFDESIYIAKKNIVEKKIDEITESKDVLVYKLISAEKPDVYYKIQDLTNVFRLMMGEGFNSDWLNSQWMGRSLKRLNLITTKRRTGEGIEVMLDVEKAKRKIQMFTCKLNKLKAQTTAKQALIAFSIGREIRCFAVLLF